ncbi:MAG TPA: outer membrane beta-barrel protein [Bacteroidia bacterium]|nr:outer membrane beta-barrel protein [Bacteroidia bacterium]
MKGIRAVVVLCCIVVSASAQYPLSKGQSQFNGGLGLSSWGIPVYLGLDYGIHKDISLGGELSFRSYRENWNNARYNHAVLGLSANGNYHFNQVLDIPMDWDLYAGLNLGFYLMSSPDNYNGSSSSGLGLGLQIGGRYYFKDNVGIQLEFGGGNAFSGGKVGISVKF